MTVYNEEKNLLEKTLNGLLANLMEFKKMGISNNEMLIVVMFDGIDKINDDAEDNDKNMFKLFWEFDTVFGIESNRNMKY